MNDVLTSIKSSLTFLSLLCVICFISACAPMPKPEGKPLATITFAHIEPISVNASQISVEASPSITSPAASYFNPQPSVALVDYLNNKFVTKTDSNDTQLTIYVPEISIQEKSLPSSMNTILYILARIDLTYTHPSQSDKTTSLQARRTTTLSHNMSISQREKAAQDMMKELIDDLDPILENKVIAITTTAPVDEE